MPRVREVVSEVRLLVEDLKKRGISDAEIMVGIVVGLQTEPVTQALAQNPEVADFFDKIKAFVKSGADLINLTKKS